MNKRIGTFDIAKGIGVLLVVMGHNDFFTSIGFLRQFIYSFHVPLFFFLSGIFFKPDIGLITVVTKKFHSLLKPYLVTLLLLFLFSVSFTKVNLPEAFSRLVKSLYSTGHYLDWVPLWFLPHLFLLSLFAWGFYALTSTLRLPTIVRILAITIFVGVGLSYIGAFWPLNITLLGKELQLFGLPLSADLLLVSGFYFILGKECNQPWLEKFISSKISLVGSLVLLLAMVFIFPSMLDMASRVADGILPIFLASLAGILFVLSLSNVLNSIPVLANPLSHIGNLTLFILLFHMPIQETWGEKVMTLTNIRILAATVSYTLAVGLPALIGHFVIKPNPYTRALFMETGKADLESSNLPPNA